jgi:hydroxylamine reductase
MKITKNTLIAEITEKYPEIGEVLVEDYGFHCVGCFASEMETFEQGAQVHGYTDKEIKEMLSTLNKLIEDIEANKKSEK